MNMTELRLKTHLFEEVRDFYAQELGFFVLDEDADSVTFDVGHTHLVFEADTSQEHTYHFAFNVPPDDLADAQVWLAQHTPLLYHNGECVFEHGSWGAKAIYYRDPAGNIGEFIARDSISESVGIPFSVQSIIGISEVGLATKHVPELVEWLQETLNLPIKDHGDEQFAAIGDDEGLLIIVRKGRPWFPTDAKATQSPIHLTLRGERSDVYHLPHTPYVINTVVE